MKEGPCDFRAFEDHSKYRKVLGDPEGNFVFPPVDLQEARAIQCLGTHFWCAWNDHWHDQHCLRGVNMFLTFAVMPKVQAGKRHQTHSQANVSGAWCAITLCYGQWGDGKDLFQKRMQKKTKDQWVWRDALVRAALEIDTSIQDTGANFESEALLLTIAWGLISGAAVHQQRCWHLGRNAFPLSSDGSSTRPCPAQVGMCRHLHRHQAATNNSCTLWIYWEYVGFRISLQFCK